MKFTTSQRAKSSHLIKWLPVITITLLPSAVMAQQFTPEQMLDVMTKSPSNRDVRVHDTSRAYTQKIVDRTPITQVRDNLGDDRP